MSDCKSRDRTATHSCFYLRSLPSQQQSRLNYNRRVHIRDTPGSPGSENKGDYTNEPLLYKTTVLHLPLGDVAHLPNT